MAKKLKDLLVKLPTQRQARIERRTKSWLRSKNFAPLPNKHRQTWR